MAGSALAKRTEAQRAAALESANDRRVRRARLKAALQAGELSLVDVLETRSDLFADTPLVDVVRYAKSLGPRKFQALCRSASYQGVNLGVTLGAANSTTVDWLVCWVSGSRPRVPRNADSEAAKTLMALSKAVLEHKRLVTGPQTSGEAWATADETLWQRHDRIMSEAA